MTTYHLYVKTHRKTGLKYLGYTSQKDPSKYPGSGKYWKLHQKVHGNYHDTEILFESTSKEEISALGKHYSLLWNIVDSDQWANLKIEEGDGAATGEHNHMKRPEFRAQASAWMLALGENHPNKRPEERAKRLGKKRPEHSKAMAGSNNPMYGVARDWNKGALGYKWYTNGIKSIMSNECPTGYRQGRTKKST